jgi:NitT/TauT family transport system ATP-binding protein
MPAPKIQIKNLGLVYGARRGQAPVVALDGLTLDVGERELTCIVGPSGCGKTTLLRVAAGLEQASAGSLLVRPDGSARPLIGMVFQGAGLFPWMTVLDNVAYGLRLRGVPATERMALASRWVGEVGLSRFGRAYPAQLSGGMQQRVGLARALAYDPQVLLMDEPFGALDAQTRLLLQQLLLEQWERATRTVLFVTHSIEEALTLGDRVYVMSARPGRLLHETRVPFERPRDAALLRGDPRFSQLFSAIWGVLRDEVERARADEGVEVAA